MAEKTVCISQQQTEPIKISKWKVREGITVSVGRPLLLFNILGDQKAQQRKLKSTQAGTIQKILAKEGDVVNPGEGLLELSACSHPTIMHDMCAECGADLRKNDIVGSASVSMVHAIPDLKVSEEVARKLGQADSERLIRDRKLVLLVDLDQTLIHTTNDNIPPNIKDVYHFQLYGPNSRWYHTRLRPATHKFLNNIHDFYELHICTFGARNYAHTIALFLDGDQKIFSNRILSRDECFDPTSKKANLKALFPCGDNMVCIIDDREDVWSHASNLIHVKPYHFFQHTGDINAPPGLNKQENDEHGGVDLTKIRGKVIKKKIDTVQSDELPRTENDDNSKENEIYPEVQKLDNSQEKCDTLEENGTIVISQEKIKPSPEKSDIEKNGVNIESQENVEKAKGQTEKIAEIGNNNNEKTESEGSPKPNNENEEVQTDCNEKETMENKESSHNETTENNDINKKAGSNEISKEQQQPNLQPNPEENGKKSDDDLIEIEDPDDYLIYLEEILKLVHKEFYDEYDLMESGDVPDLKKVIPRVRRHVLKGCHLAFSGLVPWHVELERSRAYQVARSLGATVVQELDDRTTHLVAVRPGTAKVNAARRRKHLKIVTPDWLWCCAERWEHADERIFPLKGKGSKNRHPPPHCSRPEHHRDADYPEHQAPGARKRTPSGRFMDTINPLMSFSRDDIADMDKEVEDIFADDSESSDDEPAKPDAHMEKNISSESFEDLFADDSDDEPAKPDAHMEQIPEFVEKNISSSSDSEDSMTGEFPKGFKRKRQDEEADLLEDSYVSEEDESPSVRFRRGETVDDVLDFELEDTQGSVDAPDEVDDGEWNMMGAALEREFLSNN
ncbi:unnamed protein product [Phaedon cochleariae]|uniref:RNA polymerase II subunit A C-terminal domain phosphatase n=1 Tax=Phaedon cochleariae TaxID=80249 RepID=A0A9P0DG34_PHACE|nr:unnamed protein product [Phaedon cochleariae]